MSSANSNRSKQETSSGMHHVQSISGVAEFGDSQQTTTRKDPNASSTAANNGSNNDNDNTINAFSATAGARILFATDDWFARAEHLLNDTAPHFNPDAFCVQGKVMDGWETRRRREAGHDWCIVQLAERSRVQEIEIDTGYFTGNQVPKVSLDVCDLSGHGDGGSSNDAAVQLVRTLPGAVERVLYGGVQGTGATPTQVAKAEQACAAHAWTELLPESELAPGYEESRYHRFLVVNGIVGTHVRINYFPDGGVARMRLHSTPAPCPTVPYELYTPIVTGRTCTVVPHTSDLPLPSATTPTTTVMTNLTHGGVGVRSSNQHYGEPSKLLQDTYGRDMGDGWETARHPHRPPVVHKSADTGLTESDLSDWAVLELGTPGTVQRVILDTRHFRGNYPESVLVQGCSDVVYDEETNDWFELVPRGRMAPDAEHDYSAETGQLRHTDLVVRRLRVTIFPDGGVSRVRAYGTPLVDAGSVE